MFQPTPKQQEIRDHPALDVLVIAPAGSGKTECGVQVFSLTAVAS